MSAGHSKCCKHKKLKGKLQEINFLKLFIFVAREVLNNLAHRKYLVIHS